MWFSLIGNVLGLIPGLENLAASWHASALDAQVKQYIAKTGCDRDTAIAMINMQAQVQTRWWFVAAIPPLFALPYVLYTWWCVVHDNIWCVYVYNDACSTPALHGDLSTTMLMVVAFYFAHGILKS